MTFLQLVQRLRSECGVPGTGPTSVISQTGEMERLVNWISQAYQEIQLARRDWEWLRKSTSFNTVAHKQSYHPTNVSPDIALTDFSHWRNDSFWIYLTSAGKSTETSLGQCEYDSFRNLYLMGAGTITYGQPSILAVGPDDSLVLGPNPDGIYTITAEYYTTPQVLALDSDVPTMPVRFHMAIVYRAMWKYGMFNAAIELVQHGEKECSKMFTRMEADLAPAIYWGASLI